MHVRTHIPLVVQVGAPFALAGHTVQLLPHDIGLVLPFTTQVRFAPLPHSW